MIRRISFTRRADGVSYEDFQSHWRGEHAARAKLLPDLRMYVQNHAILGSDGPLLPYPGFDVCVELQYDTREVMEASLSSPEYRNSAISDQAGFSDMSRLTSMLVEPPAAADPPPGPEAVKHMTFIRRTAAAERDRFEAAVLGPYAEALAHGGGSRRELLVPWAGERAGDPPPAFDAVDIVWFENPDAALAHTTSAAAQRARWELGGLAAGVERLIAHGLRIV